MILGPVCKALPVIPHLVALFRKEERKKFALPKSGRAGEEEEDPWGRAANVDKDCSL